MAQETFSCYIFLELPHFRLQAQRDISRLYLKLHLITLRCPLVKSIVMNCRRRHVYVINFQLPLYLLKIELGGKEPFKAKKLASVTSRTPGGSGHHQGLTLWSKGTVLEKILALAVVAASRPLEGLRVEDRHCQRPPGIEDEVKRNLSYIKLNKNFWHWRS